MFRYIAGIISLMLWLCTGSLNAQEEAAAYLQKGWLALIRDNDTTAFSYFTKAYDIAVQEGNNSNAAEALLNMGICSYGISYTNGLKYAMQALERYEQLPGDDPVRRLGRSRCLQLISTIYSRQHKYKEALNLSYEALSGLDETDTTGTRGLVYNTFGNIYHIIGKEDSSAYYYRLSLREHLQHHKYEYLPQAYLQTGAIALHNNNKGESLQDFRRAYAIADSTGNRQAMVNALLSIGKWYIHFDKNPGLGEEYFRKASTIAAGLSDKNFTINSLTALIGVSEEKNDFEAAFRLQTEVNTIKEEFFNLERARITRALEIRFEVAEKEKALVILQQEKKLIKLTNWLLWG